MIYTLRDLGVPLKEIKSFMDKRNPNSVVELLNIKLMKSKMKLNYLDENKK